MKYTMVLVDNNYIASINSSNGNNSDLQTEYCYGMVI